MTTRLIETFASLFPVREVTAKGLAASPEARFAARQSEDCAYSLGSHVPLSFGEFDIAFRRASEFQFDDSPSDGMADIRDLKSRGEQSPCGFDSRLGHY